MKSSIPSTPATIASSTFVWGRGSQADNSLIKARAKDLEAQMYYGPGFDPPVNNVIVPNLFNKLDAQCRERTRVMNTVLDRRLGVQERVITRHRDVSQKVYAKEKAKLKEDLRKIGKKLPSFVKLYQNTDVELLEKQVKKQPVPLSKFGLNLPEERHYCFRYFEHHNPVRIARRISEGIKKDLKKLEKSMENDLPVESLGAIIGGVSVQDTSLNPGDKLDGQTTTEIYKTGDDIERLVLQIDINSEQTGVVEESILLESSELQTSLLTSRTVPSTDQRSEEHRESEEERMMPGRRNSHRSGTSCSF